MGELKLNIYYKRLSVANKNVSLPKREKFSSLDSLAPIHDKLKFSEQYKSKHFKYLDFLRELQAKTKQRTLPGELSLTELRSKHHVSPLATKILIENHMLHEFGTGRGKTCYRWATIQPVMAMAEKLMQDIDRREAEKQDQKMIVLNTEQEEALPAAPFDMKKMVELLTYHLPTPPDLNYTLVNQYIKSAVSEHIQGLQASIISHINEVMPGIIDSIVKSFPVPEPAKAPEVRVVHIDKITDTITEHHHHHYVTKATEQKKGRLTTLLSKI